MIPKGQTICMTWDVFFMRRVYARKRHTSSMRISGGISALQKYVNSSRIPLKKKCLVIANFITLHFKMSQLYHLRYLQLQIWSFLVTSYAFKLFSLYLHKNVAHSHKTFLCIHKKCQGIVCISLLKNLFCSQRLTL